MPTKTLKSKSTRFEKLKDIKEKPSNANPPTKNVKTTKKRQVFTAQRPSTMPHDDLFKFIKKWAEKDGNLYLGFGGTGDALLLLASCWDDEKAKPIFFVNPGSITLVEQFFKFFKLDAFLHSNIMGFNIAGKIFTHITEHPNFKTSGHLADGLYHGDWKNEDKYIERINSSVPWKQFIGTHETNKKSIALGITGSDRSLTRQRFLTHKEYEKLIDKYNDQGLIIYCVGSEDDYKYYNLSLKLPVTWLTSNKIISQNKEMPINLEMMLKIINGVSEVISVDTWLKTYSLLTGIPTKIIRTRWNGNYRPYGTDITDYIFLSKKIWNKIEFVEIEDLLRI